MTDYSFVRQLEVPYDVVRTIYAGTSEVRLYQNNETGGYRVGKRVDLLGLEDSIAVSEVDVLSSLDHPNVVPVHDVLTVTGYSKPLHVVEIMMPYFQDGSVYDYLESGQRMSLREASQMVQAGLTGLGHLHEVHGLLHRDVKSANLLLSGTVDRLKVGDLGIAARMNADGLAQAYPQAGHLYVPPETHTSGVVGRSGDVYGMGMVLFEVADRPFPYGRYTQDFIGGRIEAGHRGPPPRDLRYSPHVPSGMRRVITKAIAKEPARRFQSVRDMSDALSKVRMIDWSRIHHDEDGTTWEGAAVQRPDRIYRVEVARARKGNMYRMTAYQRVNVWRRIGATRVVTDPYGPEATAFFDNLVTLAVKR